MYSCSRWHLPTVLGHGDCEGVGDADCVELPVDDGVRRPLAVPVPVTEKDSDSVAGGLMALTRRVMKRTARKATNSCILAIEGKVSSLRRQHQVPLFTRRFRHTAGPGSEHLPMPFDSEAPITGGSP